jgi:hypothetical protein
MARNKVMRMWMLFFWIVTPSRHGVTTKKNNIDIFTAMRTSDVNLSDENIWIYEKK